jgi:hypothetical protein
MPRANRYFLPGYVRHITLLNEASSKRSSWFDGLTMSGFILNRFAPFNPWICPGTFS